ncbi:hypothetical protein C5167_004111 [Papaver somniferum]|nr:hypothetical protein C5167_004111 [Papaver somniferum]
MLSAYLLLAAALGIYKLSPVFQDRLTIQMKRLPVTKYTRRGAKRIRLHILTDGRDILDGSSVGFVETIENDLAQLRADSIHAELGLVMSHECHNGPLREPKANDQYLPPFVIVDDSGPVLDGDAVVTFNFRADCMTTSRILTALDSQRSVMLVCSSIYLFAPPDIEKLWWCILGAQWCPYFCLQDILPYSGTGADLDTLKKIWKQYVALPMIHDEIEQVGGIYLVTADHGNPEDAANMNKKV